MISGIIFCPECHKCICLLISLEFHFGIPFDVQYFALSAVAVVVHLDHSSRGLLRGVQGYWFKDSVNGPQFEETDTHTHTSS